MPEFGNMNPKPGMPISAKEENHQVRVAATPPPFEKVAPRGTC